MSERLNRDQIEYRTLEKAIQSQPVQPDPNDPHDLETDSEVVVRSTMRTPPD